MSGHHEHPNWAELHTRARDILASPNAEAEVFDLLLALAAKDRALDSFRGFIRRSQRISEQTP